MDEFLAQGKRGQAFLRKEGKRTLLVKKLNPHSAVDTIEHEANFTKLLNTKGIGPKFYSYENGELIREYVKGTELRKWLPTATKEETRNLMLNILAQGRAMDELGVQKQELTRPWKDIIVRKNLPVLIDFERCRKNEHPKNVTQLCQFFTGSGMTEVLTGKELFLDKEALLILAKAYKDAMKKKEKTETKKIFLQIKRMIEN